VGLFQGAEEGLQASKVTDKLEDTKNPDPNKRSSIFIQTCKLKSWES